MKLQLIWPSAFGFRLLLHHISASVPEFHPSRPLKVRGVPIPSACDKTWVPAPMLKDIQTWLTGKSRGKKSFEGTNMEKGPISTLIPPCVIEKTVPTTSNHPVHHASKQMLSLVKGPYCTAAAQSRSCEFSLSSVRRSPANHVSHATQSPKDLCKWQMWDYRRSLLCHFVHWTVHFCRCHGHVYTFQTCSLQP